MQQKNLLDCTNLGNLLHWSLVLHLGKSLQELLDDCLTGEKQAGGGVIHSLSFALEHGDHQPVEPSLSSIFFEGFQHPECFPKISEM